MMTENLFDPLSSTAMILAAGFGTRLRPLTLAKPKPLFEVGGRAMLDQALDHLKEAGIQRVVVNAHYLADQIAAHIAARRDVETVLSYEEEILDNGGGVKNARRYFGDKPFFVLNADLPWTEAGEPALSRMARAWDGAKMDVLLLLYPTDKAKGFAPRKDGGQGDFMMEPDGRVWRKNAPQDRPYVYISAMLVKPQPYDEINERIFSNNKIFDLAERSGRLFGLVHRGACYQISSPEDLAEANRLLETGQGWG